MAEEKDGNVQDVKHSDKVHPAVAATAEAQAAVGKQSVIVPMPAVTIPNHPEAAGGSINFDISQHPMKHDPDFGKGVEGVHVEKVEDVHAHDTAPAKPKKREG